MEYLIEYADYMLSLSKVFDKIDKIDYISSSTKKELDKLGISEENLEKYLGFIENSIYIKDNIDNDLITDLFFDIRDDFNYIDISYISYNIKIVCNKHSYDKFDTTYVGDISNEKPINTLANCLKQINDSMIRKKIDKSERSYATYNGRDYDYYKFNDFSEYANFLNFSFIINISLDRTRDFTDDYHNNNNNNYYDDYHKFISFRDELKRILYMFSVVIKKIDVKKKVSCESTPYSSSIYPSFNIIIE